MAAEVQVEPPSRRDGERLHVLFEEVLAQRTHVGLWLEALDEEHIVLDHR